MDKELGIIMDKEICIVFQHGAGMTKDTWDGLIEALGKHFPAKYHAWTIPMGSLEQMVNQLQKHISSLNRKIVLIGHSLGGAISSRICNPNIVALILIDCVEAAGKLSLERIDTIQQNQAVNVQAIKAAREHWSGWFEGCTDAFLAHPAPIKAIVVSTTSAIEADRKLLIASMQGKFQVVPVPHSTHFLHSEKPTVMADALLPILKRLAKE